MDENLFKVETNDVLMQLLTNVKNRLIVILYSAQWCGPCKQIKPKFIELSEKKKEILFLYIDVDNYDAEDDNVEALPTFMFYKDNNKLDSFEGANEEKLKEMLNIL
jgi:thioredoxin 1